MNNTGFVPLSGCRAANVKSTATLTATCSDESADYIAEISAIGTCPALFDLLVRYRLSSVSSSSRARDFDFRRLEQYMVCLFVCLFVLGERGRLFDVTFVIVAIPTKR